MPRKKLRLEKSRTPNKFSVHISDSNLKRLEELREHYDLNNRNETINFCIESRWEYEKYKDLIIELKKLKGNGGKI